MRIWTERWFHGALALVASMAWSAGHLAAQDLDWATRAGGTDFEQGQAIATDGAGNSYVTGHFSGTATFGAGEANETVLTGSFDFFLSKYETPGWRAGLGPALRWIRLK